MRKPEQDKAKAAIQLLIEEVNGGSPAALADVIFEQLTKSHRTLQQSFIGALKIAITKYGQLEPVWTDLRNEAAWRWAKQVAEMDPCNLRFPMY